MSTKVSPRLAIIDYGLGNLFSVSLALRYVGFNTEITNDRKKILESNGIVIPGVGAFKNAMDNLKELGLVETIKEYAAGGKPCLGICLGMQLLFTESEEFGVHQGLGILKGRVKRFKPFLDNANSEKVPQVGWNRIFYPDVKGPSAWKKTPLSSTGNGEYMYFVHSYYAEPVDKDVVLSETEYAGIRYCSSVAWKNIFAFQFHPERSAEKGLDIYRTWVKHF